MSKLKDYLTANSITPPQLQAMCIKAGFQISTQSIYQYLKEGRTATLKTAKAIASVLGVGVEDIF